MQIILIRHGETPGNALRRYIGSTDEPLSPRGVVRAKMLGCDSSVEKVFVTPLLRTAQTAKILFPNAVQEVIPDLREMDFGVFENRSAEDMASDEAYLAWVDGGCLGQCPRGESPREFRERVCRAFGRIVEKLMAESVENAVFLVHGGTIMAIMEGYAFPAMDYYDAHVGNCEGYICSVISGEYIRLENIRPFPGLK